MARIPKASPSNEGQPPPPPSQPAPSTRPPSPSAHVALHALQRTTTQRRFLPVTIRGTPLPPVLTIPIEVPLDARSESPSPVVPGDPADWSPEMLERIMGEIDAQIEARDAAAADSRRARSPPSSPVLEWDLADLSPHELARALGEIEIAADVQRSPSPTGTGTPPPSSESDIDTSPPSTRPPSPALCDIPAEDLNLVLASFGAATTTPTRSSTPQIVRDIANYSDEDVHQLMVDIGMMYVKYNNIADPSDPPLQQSSPGTPPTPRTSPRTVQEAGAAFIRELHRSGMITPVRSPTISSTVALRSTLAPTDTPLSVRTRRTTSTSLVTPPSSPPHAPVSMSTPTPIPASSRSHPPRGPTDTYLEDGIPNRLRDWTRNYTSDMLYVVNKGRAIGIFDDWLLVKNLVDGFPGNGYKSFLKPSDAWHTWSQANIEGNTRGAVHPRSLVGKVRVRGEGGAPPPYTEN